MRGVFVTGTDTGVGKTAVSCWLVRELSRRGVRVGACKPAASGAIFRDGQPDWEDPRQLSAALGNQFDERLVTPIRLREPLAPPVAAKREGRTLVLADYTRAIEAWENRCDYLVVEGVGGWLCPITSNETIADLAAWWGRPILIVARLGLGTINHTLLTVESVRKHGLKTLGAVINDCDADGDTLAHSTNPDELRARLDLPVWGPIAHQSLGGDPPQAVREICDSLLLQLGTFT